MAYRLAGELTVPPSTASGDTNGDAEKGTALDEDELRDHAFRRLEMLGYRVGQGLVER